MTLLEFEYKSGKSIKISPIDSVVGVDGREFFIDGDSVVKNTKEIGVDLVLDKNHQDREALGWFELDSLELKEDGIYASLNLTTLGKDALKNRFFRYLSPSFVMDKNGVDVKYIDSIGLVNRPNILKDSLSQNSLANSEIDALRADIETLKASIASMEGFIKKEKIESSIREGKILPNSRDALIDMPIDTISEYIDKNRTNFSFLKDEVELKDNSSKSAIFKQLGI